jgi:hypothetical protein
MVAQLLEIKVVNYLIMLEMNSIGVIEVVG